MSTIDYTNHPQSPDYDPTKDADGIPLTSAAQAAAARIKTLHLIQQAQTLLYAAAQTSCPLQGWVDQWEMIGNHADATKALWHSINNASRPTGHDEF
jgi:hypothetical protein